MYGWTVGQIDGQGLTKSLAAQKPLKGLVGVLTKLLVTKDLETSACSIFTQNLKEFCMI